jgi:ABC-2 type transport system permease protein
MSITTGLVKKGWWRFRNTGRILREQSPFKVIFITLFALGFEVGLYLLFLDGFRFLDQLGGAGSLILNHLFALFFMGMGAMLVMSGIVTGYSTIFRSDEIPFLLTHPFTISRIVLYTFMHAALYASWSFGFVVIPFTAAYAWFLELSPLFALWTLLFSLPFLLLCAAIGSMAALLLVRWSPTGRALKILCAAIPLVAGVMAWSIWREAYDPGDNVQFTLSRLIPGLRPAANKLAPSWWVASGILALTRGDYARGSLLWVVLASTCAVLIVAIEWIGSATFLDSWRRVVGGRPRGRHAPVLFPFAEHLLRGIGADVRAVALKDIRLFFRDPSQWTQALVFFGLLALYFSNLRNFHYHALPDAWRNTITFLNVFSVSAVVCSLGSRFVYPQLSLEGQGFWVLGLSPVRMSRIVHAKFALALVALLPISMGLMLLSGAMLRADWPIRLLAVGLAASISLAVSGLSTGLGAIFLDLRSRNPAAIVSSFGGTLNLVLSLAFMLLTIVPFGLIFHARIGGLLSSPAMARAVTGAIVWVIALTAVTTVIPLRLGAKSLAHRDY